MSLRLVPAGATISRTYLAIPSDYSIGVTFPSTDEGWAAAVEVAQAKRAMLIQKRTEALGAFMSPEAIAKGVNRQVRIDLRWVIAYDRDIDPAGLGGSMDTIVESYTDVDSLVARPGVRA